MSFFKLSDVFDPLSFEEMSNMTKEELEERDRKRKEELRKGARDLRLLNFFTIYIYFPAFIAWSIYDKAYAYLAFLILLYALMIWFAKVFWPKRKREQDKYYKNQRDIMDKMFLEAKKKDKKDDNAKD